MHFLLDFQANCGTISCEIVNVSTDINTVWLWWSAAKFFDSNCCLPESASEAEIGHSWYGRPERKIQQKFVTDYQKHPVLFSADGTISERNAKFLKASNTIVE